MLALLLLSALSPGDAFMRFPAISGDRVAYVREGDLWLGDLSTGKAHRLTRHEGRETMPRFSPDGRLLAFSGEYDGVREVYVMPVEGGIPRRLTYMEDNAEPLDWSPDGKQILFRARSIPVSWRLFTVPVEGGFPRRLPIEFASHACFTGPNRIVFTRFQRSDMAWFGYDGGRVNQIWLGDSIFDEPKFRVFAKERKGSCEYPAFADGAVWYAGDADGQYRLLRSGNAADAGLPRPDKAEIRNLTSDGRRLIYEKGDRLEVFDPASRSARPVAFEMASDLIHARPYRVPADRTVQGATLGPTGKRVLVETRGQIASIPAGEGEARVLLARPGVRYRMAALSPDGKKMAYIDDSTGEEQVFVAEADGSNPRQVTSDPNRQLRSLAWSTKGSWLTVGDSEGRLRLLSPTGSEERVLTTEADPWTPSRVAFSPDEKWLVFEIQNQITWAYSIALYDIEKKTLHTLGERLNSDFSPVFSPDGKYLAFLSRRNFDPIADEGASGIAFQNVVEVFLLTLRKDLPSPLAPKSEEDVPAAAAQTPTPPSFGIDLDGLYRRLVALPAPPKNYTRLAFAGERLLLQFAEGDRQRLTYFDLSDKSQGAVAEGFTSFEVSANGKRLLLYAPGAIRVVDANATNVPPSGNVSFGGLQLAIDPVAEWRQMFWDAWRLHRDYFYVRNLHGANWPEIGRRYAAMLPSVRSRDELDQLIRWMQAELVCSHAFLGTGDTRSLFRAAAPSFLGIDVEAHPSGYFKIASIFRGDGFGPERSPLAEPGLNVSEGDYLIEVAGVPAKPGTDFLAGLVGRAGQIVSIKVASTPSAAAARTILVRPIASERELRYKEWVRKNREEVSRLSGGRIGYLHLANMGREAYGAFVQQYLPQRDKDALIVDVRFNSGGYVSDFVSRILQRKVVTFWNQRAGPVWTRQGDAFAGPMACLINEYCFSDGELFPDAFRQLQLGPLIGRKTSGGEVGSDPGWPLADGGSVNVPNYGAWRPGEGWIIEKDGVEPDIDVPSDPNAFAEGRDRQLERAVEQLLGTLQRNPVVRPTPPPDPVRARGGGKG